MTSTNLSLPYKIGFATLTASALLILGADGEIPSLQRDIESKVPLVHQYSWESPFSITNADFYDHNKEALQQIETLQTFAEKVLANSKDLPFEITDIVSDNFEDLLA